MQVKKILQVVVIGLLLATAMFAQKKQDAPDWARGTWYWTNGPDRSMTIANDGRITLVTAGTTTYGVYNKGKIYLNGNASSITQVGNNIRTYNESTGETSDYARNPWSGNNNGNNGNWNNNKKQAPPTWARGTWYWTNGPDRTMTINGDGQITLLTAGQTSYGRYWKNKIYLDGITSTMTQSGNNIRTYNETTGETSDYSHNRWNNGNGNGNGNWNGNGNGGMEAPPDWARGTWYWTNGPDRRLTIDNNGRITLYTAGQTTSGRYWKGYIYLDGNRSTVTKNGNKIRTYNETTGESSDYSKSIWRKN